MNAIQELLSSLDITSIIFYIFLFFFAFKGAFEVSEYFYEKVKNFFAHKTESKTEMDELKEDVEELADQFGLLQLSIQAQTKDIEDIKLDMKKDKERHVSEMAAVFKLKHHKYMALGAIDDLTLESLEKKYSYYKNQGGNGYVETLIKDIRGLKVVDYSTMEKIKAQHREEASK